jgi:CHAT domain-containing protein/tetratricopeptide (TPR) repeat protein
LLNEGNELNPEEDAWETIKRLEPQLNENPWVAVQLIQAYQELREEMAEFLEPEEDSSILAFISLGLGSAYLLSPEGDRGENLRQAIAYCKQALEFIDATSQPYEYGRAQNNLGLAYSDLPTGDPSGNLAQAIACFEEALRFYTPESMPDKYAHIQTNLGNVYWKMPSGDRVSNLERAIACHQEALRFLTPEKAPLDYALVQSNLGIVYTEFPIGNRTTHLERALDCYAEALRFLTLETTPFEYARTQANMGSAYRDLPTGDHIAHLTQALKCFQESLRAWNPEHAPHEYAMVQTNLGNVHLDLAMKDRRIHLTHAIACYQEALHFLDPKKFPFDYAFTQTNLGNAYYQRSIGGDRVADLTQAISCLQEALRFWLADSTPQDYAGALLNLGNAYSDLPTGDRTANLKQALACYQEALRFRTPEVDPFEYARIQTCLGNTYSKLPTGDRTANLKQALTCHQEALRFWTPDTDPLHYAIAQTNLGSIYYALPTGERQANLTRALHCYQEALRFWTLGTDPFHHAILQTNLGCVYHSLSEGEGDKAYLKRAIECHQQALSILTPDAVPLSYALVQVNVGLVYQDLAEGNDIVYLQQAIASYQEALRFYTGDTAPYEYRTTNRHLADIYLAQHEWQLALQTYQEALSAGERLYQAGLSSESKMVEIGENRRLYLHATLAAIHCMYFEKAFSILERGKTRLLNEALRLRTPRPSEVPEKTWDAFEYASATLRARVMTQTAALDRIQEPLQTFATYEQAMQSANATLDAAIEQIRTYTPTFLKPFDLSTVQTLLLDDATALVSFCITDQGSYGLIVSQCHRLEVQVVELPDCNTSALRRLLAEVDEEGSITGGWLGMYTRFVSESTSLHISLWQETMTQTLAALGKTVFVSLLSALSPGIGRIIFLPSSDLFLFPLHAVPLNDQMTELVCDRYQVSYAPSVEVLLNCKVRASSLAPSGLYAVINPEKDIRLGFSQLERRTLLSLFSQHHIDEGGTGTKQRVLQGARGQGYIHFSCHGRYDWDRPSESALHLADGHLTLAELQRGEVDLSTARLVTLSACETGVVDVLRGITEEYVSIPAGFLLAGVPCVVSSLWAVYDFSTALLMERFYENHLRHQMNFVMALHEAQMWIRHLAIREIVQQVERWYTQAQPRTRSSILNLVRYYRQQEKLDSTMCPFVHPYYWAAFTVNGI